MREKLSDQLKKAREYFTKYISSSRMISRTPTFIASIHICPANPASSTRCILYNGVSTTDPIILESRAQYVPDCVEFDPPIYVERGLYVNFHTNIASMTIQYKSIPA